MWKESTKSPTVEPSRGPALPPERERRVVTCLGKSVSFKGALASSEDMIIDGRVEGTIDVPEHAVTIGPDADIRAEIAAHLVTIHGTVTGNVRANDKIDVRATGHLDGDLIAPRIVIAEGASIRGHVETATEPSEAVPRAPELVTA
jgi:cytoskeletal protein CcmA (bactofilin family)